MAKVAILIPSYNHGRYLKACLSSIQAQTFRDWEVVLIDDGSTDDSVALAQEIAHQDPRIRVLTNETNLGTYGTEQRALELSESEYVAVMNSDDLWLPDKLQRQLTAFEESPAARVCYVLGWMVDDSGAPLTKDDVHADWPVTPVQDPLPYLLYENRILASGVLFRREGLRFETTCRYSGDWVALLQATKDSPAVCISDRLVYWRQHDNNTYKRSAKQMIEEIRVRRSISDRPDRWAGPGRDEALVRRGLMMNELNLSNLCLYFLDRDGFMNHGRRAVEYGFPRLTMLKRLLAGTVSIRKTRSYIWRLDEYVPESACAEARSLIRSQSKIEL